MHENAGSLIRSLRRRLGLTQEELARELSVTASTVNRWENAHAAPSKLARRAIEDFVRRRGLAEVRAAETADPPPVALSASGS